MQHGDISSNRLWARPGEWSGHLHRVGLAAAGCSIGKHGRVDALEDARDEGADLLVKYVGDPVLLAEVRVHLVALVPAAWIRNKIGLPAEGSRNRQAKEVELAVGAATLRVNQITNHVAFP